MVQNSHPLRSLYGHLNISLPKNMRKYSYEGSSHLWKAVNISIANCAKSCKREKFDPKTQLLWCFCWKIRLRSGNRSCYCCGGAYRRGRCIKRLLKTLRNHSGPKRVCEFVSIFPSTCNIKTGHPITEEDKGNTQQTRKIRQKTETSIKTQQ